MGLPEHNHYYTVAEYLELECQTGIKYQYDGGEVFTMAGGTTEHSLIGNNVGGELRRALLWKCFLKVQNPMTEVKNLKPIVKLLLFRSMC
jgi:hypothetical protein